MGGKRGKKSKKTKTKAQKMAVANKAKYGGTAKAAAANKAANKAKAKSYTKSYGAASVAAANKQSMKDAASDRNKKFQQTKVQTFGGKKTSFTSKEQTRIKDAGYKVEGYSQAKFKPTPKPTPKVDRIDGAKVAGVTGYGLRPDGVTGEYKEGDVFNTGGKSGKDYIYKGVPGKGAFVPVKTAMLGNISGLGIGEAKATGFTPSIPGLAESLGIDSKTGLDSGKGPSYTAIKSPESFGAPSQEAVDKAAGITAGGLNIGGSGFTPDKPSGSNARAIFPGASPNSVLNDPNFKPGPVAGDPFAQPGPGGSEPEADYTSYQPGSFYNQSDTNMNLTNALRSGRNIVTTPFRALGINNQFTNMLIPKSNEAIQDARDQRKPVTLTKKKSGGGARLPIAPLTPEEILLPEQVAAQTGPDYQQAAGQTGVDPNRLLQIQQQAYAQAFNPYNPLTVGGFNPMFRFFNKKSTKGAFSKAFKRKRLN